MVFDKLIEAGFAAKCTKVWLAQKSVPYLGFSTSEEGMRPLTEKTAALLDMVCEDMGSDAKAAARYAGMLGFYSQFLPNLHSTLAPFHDLKAKGADSRYIMGTLRFKASFAVTKHQLANVTALTRPDYAKPFYIDVDSASSVGSGAVLSQRVNQSDPDSHRPIAFWSRRFKGEEMRYGVRDQECLGLVDSLDAWRHFVWGAHTIVRTDHESLQWLLRTNHRDGTRVSGLALKAQGYDVQIEYVPGKSHIAADCISRAIPHDGEERGSMPPHRPHIEERVEEALQESIQQKQKDGVTAASAVAYILANRDALVAHVVPIVAAHVYTASNDQSKNEDGYLTVQHAVALVVRCNSSQQIEVLVEQQDQLLSLPSVRNENPQDHSTWRHLLQSRLNQTYGPSLSQLLRSAPQWVQRTSGMASVKYFVIVLPTHFPDPTPISDDHAILTSFFPLNVATILSLGVAQDRLASNAFMRSLASTNPRSLSTRRVLERLGWADSLSYSASSLDLESFERVHTIQDKPFGPALVSSPDDSKHAVSLLCARLAKYPKLSVSVDLEGHALGAGGHVSLIQVSIDSVGASEPRLTFVFDTGAKSGTGVTGDFILGSHGKGTLRSILEDPSVVKVFHCCYGDTAALYHNYGILVANVFDTGVADSLCMNRHANKPRGLGKVLIDWLGDTVVTLSYKGSMEWTDDLWEPRPLTPKLFVYSYEDVTYCNLLYLRLSAQLSELGLSDLCKQLSQQRAPLRALPLSHPLHTPAIYVTIALVDDLQRVLCIRRSDGDSDELPCLPLSGQRVVSAQKDAARQMWVDVMGAAPKSVRSAVTNRLRKGTRIGDSMLYLACVPDCTTVLSELQSSLPDSERGANSTLVLRSQLATDGVSRSQAPLFQYLKFEASRRVTANSAVASAFFVGTCNTEETHSTRIHVDAQLRVESGHVRLRLFQTLTVASASVTSVTRASVILHDSASVLVAVRRNHQIFLPSHSISEEETAKDAAQQSFDMHVGTSVRKRANPVLDAGHHVMPRTAAMVNAACDRALSIGSFGNTEYFSWLAVSDGQSTLSTLFDHRASFYAARTKSAGFQMTEAKSKTLISGPGGVRLIPISTALEKLDEFDRNALDAAVARASGAGSSQHSEHSSHGHRVQETTSHQTESNSTQVFAAGVSQHSDTSAPFCPIPGELPPVGANPEFDALFISAVAYKCGILESTSHSSVQPTVTCAVETAPTGPTLPRPGSATYTEFAAAGVRYWYEKYKDPDQTHVPHVLTLVANHKVTRTAILEAQLEHPGTRQYLDALKQVSDLAPEGFSPPEDISSHRLSDDGLLLYKSSQKGGDRIVIPPQFQTEIIRLYHDLSGHFGVNKVLKHVTQRFYWGPDDMMRKAISEHIKHCDACKRTRLPRHRGGEFHVIDNGDHPHDVLAGDVYDVGIDWEGYTHTLDFICYFSRWVTSTAMQGMPTSEEIARVVIDVVMRQHGKPREIRSDRGSNFISAALQYLYSAMGISINAGTAYSHHLIAVVERWHQTLKQLVRVQRASKLDDNWPSRLAMMELAYNAAVNESLGYSPFFVNKGRQCVLPYDVLARLPKTSDVDMPEWVQQTLREYNVCHEAASASLRLNALHAKRKYDLKHDVLTEYAPGDLVLLIAGPIMDGAPFPKAAIPTDGPFTVSHRLDNGRYVLKDLHNRRIHNVVSAARLILYRQVASDDPKWRVSLPPTDGLWPVHSVVKRRRVKDSPSSGAEAHEYKVRWSGFAKKYDTWLSLQYLAPIFPLVRLYESTLPLHERVLASAELAPRSIDVPIPAASDAARQRARFRHQRVPPQSPPPVAEEAAPPLFEIGECIEFRSPDGSWLPGSVTHIRPQLKTADAPSGWEIVVRCTSTALLGLLTVHDSDSVRKASVVDVNPVPATPANPTRTDPSETPTGRTLNQHVARRAPLDSGPTGHVSAKLQKRLDRIARELA